jgi:hypothetical protein
MTSHTLQTLPDKGAQKPEMKKISCTRNDAVVAKEIKTVNNLSHVDQQYLVNFLEG